MSTYSITDAVSQVLLGGQLDSVSLINNGPSTIYLDDVTSVSVLNGMPLPPTGQMTWNSRAPLFAVCGAGGKATLSVNDAAGRIDASRAKFWQLLAQNSAFGYGSVFSGLEVGHCETMLLKFTVDANNQASAIAPHVFAIYLKWLDAAGNVVDYDRIEVTNLVFAAAGTPTRSLLYVRIPVIGSYVNVDLRQEDAGSGTVPLAQVFGTDRALPLAWHSTTLTLPFVVGTGGDPILAHEGTAIVQGINYTYGTGDGVSFVGLANALIGDKIFVANQGPTISLAYVANGVTTAGNMQLRTYQGNTVWGQTDFAIQAGDQAKHSEFVIPQRQALYISKGGGLVLNTLDISITWKQT